LTIMFNGSNIEVSMLGRLLVEGSTTQGPSSQVGCSPFRGEVDPTDVISYDLPEAYFYKQSSQHRSFNVAPIEHDGQVDAILTNVTNYFAMPCEVDSFFTQEGKTSQEADRLNQLSMRKAYLELALAKTLNEMKSL